MSNIFGLYFLGLFKRFFVIVFLVSFIALLLISYNYPFKTVLYMSGDLLLFSSAWLLWFNQASFTGFVTPPNIFQRFLYIIISTVLSALILMGLFSYFAIISDFNTDTIRPNIVVPKGSTFLMRRRSLLLASFFSVYSLNGA